MSPEVAVLAQGAGGHGHPGPLGAQAREDAGDLLVTELLHPLEGPAAEAEGQLAAQIEVGKVADSAVDDVHRLREEDPKQPIADRCGQLPSDVDAPAGRQGVPGLDRAEHAGGPVVLALLLHLQGVRLRDDRVAMGEVQHEERPGVDDLARDAVHLGGGGALEEQGRLVAPVVEDAVEHEAQGVGRDQRDLAGRCEERAESLDDLGVAGLGGHDLHGGILEGGGEEVGDRGALGALELSEQACRGQGAGVGGDPRVGTHDSLDRGEDPALEREVLGRRLDHPVAIRHGGVVGRRAHRALDTGRRLLAELAARDALGCRGADARDRTLELPLVDVHEQQLELGEGAHEVVADVGTDRAGAYDGDLARQRS